MPLEAPLISAVPRVVAASSPRSRLGEQFKTKKGARLLGETSAGSGDSHPPSTSAAPC